MPQSLILDILIIAMVLVGFFAWLAPKPFSVFHRRILQSCISVILLVFAMHLSGSFVYTFGKDYTYKTSPPEIKVMLDKFIDEANKRDIDVRGIYDLKITYLDWPVNGAFYEGACNMEGKTLYIPTRNITPLTVFHELGHCLFRMEHLDSQKNKSEIMYFMVNDSQKFDDPTISRFFSMVENNSLTKPESIWTINTLLNPMAWVNFILIFSVFYEVFSGIVLTLWTNRKR